MDRLKRTLATGVPGKEAQIGRYAFLGGLVVFLLATYSIRMPQHEVDAARAEIEAQKLEGPKPYTGAPVKPEAPPAPPELEGDAKTAAEKAETSAKEDHEKREKAYTEAMKKEGAEAYEAKLERWEWEQANVADLEEERQEMERELAELQIDALSLTWEHRFRFLGILAMVAGLGVLLFKGQDWERLVALFVLGWVFPQLL